MNAISSMNNAYTAYANWSFPAGADQVDNQVEADLGALDAYDASAFPSGMPAMAELDAGDQFASFPSEVPALEAAVESAASEPQEDRQGPPAAEINGDMWFFSAGSGCQDGGGGDWGGLAGLD